MVSAAPPEKFDLNVTVTFVAVQFAYNVSAANGQGAYGNVTKVEASFNVVVHPLNVKLALVGAVGSVTKL